MLCRFDVLIVRLHLQAIIAIVRSVDLLLVAHGRLVLINCLCRIFSVCRLVSSLVLSPCMEMPTAVDEIQKIERL